MCLYLNDKLSGLMTGGSWQPADASPPTIYKKKFKVQIIGPLLKGIYTLYLYVFDICISFVHATDLVFFKCSLTRVEFSKPNIEISISVTKASKLRSFEASKLRLTIDFHHFPLHFPHHFHPSSENYLFSIFVLFYLWSKKVAKKEKKYCWGI